MMTKTKKKIASILVAVTMLFPMCAASVSAANTTDVAWSMTSSSGFKYLGASRIKTNASAVYFKMKTSTAMMDEARKIVMNYFNTHVDVTDQKQITMNDVYVVWFSKTLQNWKALVSTTVSDGMYYEITHNGDKNETYVDVYKKWENFKLPAGYFER